MGTHVESAWDLILFIWGWGPIQGFSMWRHSRKYVKGVRHG